MKSKLKDLFIKGLLSRVSITYEVLVLGASYHAWAKALVTGMICQYVPWVRSISYRWFSIQDLRGGKRKAFVLVVVVSFIPYKATHPTQHHEPTDKPTSSRAFLHR